MKLLFAATVSLLLASCGTKSPKHDPSGDIDAVLNQKPVEKVNDKFWIETVKAGKGPAIKKGQRATVHYLGKLTNGKKFDSSYGKKPFVFVIGAGEVIQGWDVGVEGMKVGEKRKLTVPPEMAYGERDIGGGLIPPNSTLVFDVELLKIN